MVFRPNEYHNKDGIGMPADDIALNTTDPNTSVALLKGIFGKVGGGTTASLITEKTQGSPRPARAAFSSRARRPLQPRPTPTPPRIRSASNLTAICAPTTLPRPRC
jgi:hypothetical protein